MWSRISSDMLIGILRLSIERSRNAPLDLEGYFIERFGEDTSMHHREIRAQSFITEISQCSSRWNNIQFSMPTLYDQGFGTEAYRFYFMLAANFPRDLHVPRLKSLSISHRGYLPYSQSDEESIRVKVFEVLRFYQSWRAPKLRMLSFSRIVPAPIHGASIEVLSLDLRSRANDNDVDYFVVFHELVSFLRETPSLHTFKLSCDTSGPTYSRQNGALPTITLNHLRDLTLVLHHFWSSLDEDELSLNFFMDCIRVPNLSTLRIKLKTTTPKNLVDIDVTTLISGFIPQNELTSLNNLLIFVFDRTPSSVPNMSVALDRYPSLRYLTLGITGRLVVTPGSTLHSNMKRQRSLQQIKLLACSFGTKEFLGWLADNLGDDEVLRGVKVAVKKCNNVEKSEISKIFPSNEIEFEGLGEGDYLNSVLDSRSLGYEYYGQDDEG